MRSAALLFIASVALAQNTQPNVSNAKFEARAFSGNLESQIRADSPTWFGFEIKSLPHQGQSYCCSLENGTVTSVSSPVHLEGSRTTAVLFRVDQNAVGKIQLYPLDCTLDAGGLPFVWIAGVPASASLAYLEKLATGNNSRHLMDAALLAISRHDDPDAIALLIRIAKQDPSPHVREQALFWLAQRAGQRAAAAITDAILNDPDTAVKKRAVFALSQLPHDEGVPKLIEVARTQRNPEVRKRAFFWLGQTRDPRALAFIEQVLTK